MRCLLVLFLSGVAGAQAKLDDRCETHTRAQQGALPSAALLQKEHSLTLQSLTRDTGKVYKATVEAPASKMRADIKHPDLTDGPVPWKPDTRKPLDKSFTPSTSSSTTTSTMTSTSSSSAPASTTTAPTTTSTTTSSAGSTTSPIVVNISNVSSLGNESGGCCFTFGFGRNMEPCCLKTRMVADRSSCTEADVIGSRTSYSSERCPDSAEDAADMAEASGDILNAECTPGNSCGEGVLPKDRGLCIKPASGPSQGSSTCWDICDPSHLPEEYTLGDGDEDFAKKLAQAVQDVRDGKYVELSCPSEGDGINGTSSGDSFEDQLAAAATQASEADSMADEATVLAEQMLTEARNAFVKAMNDGATPDNLAEAAKAWEVVAAAHTRAYTAAASVAESIKVLSQLLAKGSTNAAKELAQKKEEARKKEAIARKKKEVAAKKRQEAEEAKALAVKALADAQRARAEVNASLAGSINVTVGNINATLTWNTSWNVSTKEMKDSSTTSTTTLLPSEEAVSEE